MTFIEAKKWRKFRFLRQRKISQTQTELFFIFICKYHNQHLDKKLILQQFFFKNQLLSKKDVYKKWAGPTSDPEQDFSFDRKRVTNALLLLQNTKFWRFW